MRRLRLRGLGPYTNNTDFQHHNLWWFNMSKGVIVENKYNFQRLAALTTWMRFDEVFKDDVWPRFATSGLTHAIWQPHKKVTHDWLIHNVGRSVHVLHKIIVPSLVKASSWLKQSPPLLLFLRLMFFPGVLDSEAGNPSRASFLQLSSLGKCGLTAARLFAKRFRYDVLNFVESCTWVWDCKIAWIFILCVVMVLPFE